MPRILLIVEYDGTPFAGWQDQRGLPSVQGALSSAIAIVTGEPTQGQNLLVAGRTDAGVHARGQRVTFDTLSTKEPRRFAPALNHILPREVRIHRAEGVREDYSVRRAARGKWYRYTALAGLHRSALHQARSWSVQKQVDMRRAQLAATALVGEQDFEAFRSAHCDAAHARRAIYVARLHCEAAPPIGTLWHLDLIGNAFCRHMCRIIAGTLIDIATGDRQPDAITLALASKRRYDAGQTAPPQGLTLMDIAYPEACTSTGWPAGWPDAGHSPSEFDYR